MTYVKRYHSDWKGKDGTAFLWTTPGGDTTYIYAGQDHGACHYESTSCPSGFPIGRQWAAIKILAAREAGYNVTARRYIYETPEQQLARRYPRLLRAMRWVAALSTGEALACLRDYKAGYDYSGEAVNHFGGTKAVITRAIACREPARNIPDYVNGIGGGR